MAAVLSPSVLAEVRAEYAERHPESKRLFDRLRRVLPGGETRSVTYYEPFPVGISGGAGCYITDVDGRRYVDLLNNYTALVHGHAFGPIVEAIERAAALGSVFPAPHERLAELAERMLERFNAIDLVRFTNSGSEAAELALRIARHVTGRRKIVAFVGGYHGSAEAFADPSPSVSRVEYNDTDGVRGALDRDTAAVFVEPFLGSGGVVVARPGFLDAVGRAAHAVGALFVLDEVQAARTAYNGMEGMLAEQPDLVLFGKIIGGGLPVGAVGGRHSIMVETAADRGSVKHSGTFNGNPVTSAAGVASLDALTEAAITDMNARAARLADKIERVGGDNGIPVVVTRAGSILHVHFAENPPDNAGDVTREDDALVSALHLLLLRFGVYAAPRGMLNLSTVLSDADLQTVEKAYTAAFAWLHGHW